MQWDAVQYMKFSGERLRPCRDLAAAIGHPNPRRILDLGCGPGSSAAVLQERFPQAEILGVDRDADMLEKARKNCPDVVFLSCDAGRELNRLPTDFDLVFSNACIHWIPGQAEVLREMMGRLAPGGWMAVQIPLTRKAAFYEILARVAAGQRWRQRLDRRQDRFYSLSPSEYFDILSGLTHVFSMWETVYYHRVGDYGDILEWYRGSGLRPYLAALEAGEQTDFERELLAALPARYPRQANGQIVLPMARLFMTAQKEG